MKHSHLADHDAANPYLVQWVNVYRACERYSSIEQAIARMIECGFEAITYRDASSNGSGFHRCAEYSPISGWRYSNS